MRGNEKYKPLREHGGSKRLVVPQVGISSGESGGRAACSAIVALIRFAKSERESVIRELFSLVHYY